MAKTKTKAKGYRSHGYAKPLLFVSGETYKAPKADMKELGQREPIMQFIRKDTRRTESLQNLREPNVEPEFKVRTRPRIHF